ncbi:hypothetical protein AGMMS49992_26040 [Clostridia bacterium]|nr:hypothetical protein AGMMS49992_26040 [Clostridia bacterium]
MKDAAAINSLDAIDTMDSTATMPYVTIEVVRYSLWCRGTTLPHSMLVAHVYGDPMPNDRIYLRRLHRSGRHTTYDNLKAYARKRMAHPRNPPGSLGGNLKPHLGPKYNIQEDDPGLQGNEYINTWNYTYGDPIRTEWAIHQADESIILMPLDDFADLFDDNGVTIATHSSGILIDFLVARPTNDGAGKTLYVTYGPASPLLYIRRGPLPDDDGPFDWRVTYK